MGSELQPSPAPSPHLERSPSGSGPGVSYDTDTASALRNAGPMNSPQLGSWLRLHPQPSTDPFTAGWRSRRRQAAENRKRREKGEPACSQSLHAESHGHLLRGSRLGRRFRGHGVCRGPQGNPQCPPCRGTSMDSSGLPGAGPPRAAVPSLFSALALPLCLLHADTGPQGPLPRPVTRNSGPVPRGMTSRHHFQSEPLWLTPGLRTVNRTRLGGKQQGGLESQSGDLCDF